MDPTYSSHIRFLADAGGDFTRALGLEFSAADVLGTDRSRRYAIIVEEGKVKSVAVEEDNTGLTGELREPVQLNMRTCANHDDSHCCRKRPIDGHRVLNHFPWVIDAIWLGD